MKNYVLPLIEFLVVVFPLNRVSFLHLPSPPAPPLLGVVVVLLT